jgi:hypothetical protein
LQLKISNYSLNIIPMKIIVQRHAILLAALLQILPVVRNLFINPVTCSSFAFILRWGIGTTAALGAVDAVSGATNYFTSTNIFTGTVGTPFTNNLTLESSLSNGGSLAVITSNSISAVLSTSGQSTNFAMPPGLVLQFLDDSRLISPVYDAIHGTPTTPGTNTFIISMEYASFIVSTNITIRILAGSSVAPGITNQPGSITNLVGTNPAFSVTAGPPPLLYHWFFNTNTSLPNATNATLTLTNVQLSQAGFYNVVVAGSGGAVTSTPAQLTVWQPPVITHQPAGLTNLAGSQASFSIVSGGFPALNYQWLFNSALLANATGPALTITNIHLSQAGNYSVIVTNIAGAVTSSVAPLIVTVPAAPPITSTSAAATGGLIQFTFNPVVGLTNTVQTSANLMTGTWGVLTNITPPATTNAVTIFDKITHSNQFYRIQIVP